MAVGDAVDLIDNDEPEFLKMKKDRVPAANCPDEGFSMVCGTVMPTQTRLEELEQLTAFGATEY